jgi:uncharacterized protein (TIGR02246 family)
MKSSMAQCGRHSPQQAPEMRTSTFVLALALLIVVAPVQADDAADIDATTAQWISAFNRKSTADIVALYAPDAVLFGTSSPVLRDKPALVREYFSTLPTLGNATISMGEHRVQVFGTTAVSTGFYTRSATQDGKVVNNPARFTFVYAKRDGRWVIVNHHSSALP